MDVAVVGRVRVKVIKVQVASTKSLRPVPSSPSPSLEQLTHSKEAYPAFSSSSSSPPSSPLAPHYHYHSHFLPHFHFHPHRPSSLKRSRGENIHPVTRSGRKKRRSQGDVGFLFSLKSSAFLALKQNPVFPHQRPLVPIHA